MSDLKLPEAILSVKGLRVERGDTVILEDVDWRVERGQHWVVLGANGSGKTSLLSALTGYLFPSGGDISLLGEVYGETDWRELRKRIGIVSSSVRQLMAESEPALITVASGKYAMIDFWGRVTPDEKTAALKLLHQVECAYLKDRPWDVLSQGERQRVLIARALMAKPRLLILDEPCAGLDPAARESFLNFVQRLGMQKNSPTLILVTHHVEEIRPLFTHVLLLKDGRVLVSGDKNRVLTSRNLSKTFGVSAKLTKSGDYFALKLG